jgi:glycine/D-amino acid oxidase-like deaminating enzyme
LVSKNLNSLWRDAAINDAAPREKLSSDIETDVAIIGAGFSGLWTAYYLKKLMPNSRIVIIDANEVGFGASGRNGGWCSGFMPNSIDELAELHGREAAIEMYRQSFATLDEIESVLVNENIDCDFHRGGTICGATNSVQASRVTSGITKFHDFGFTEDDIRQLSQTEVEHRINISNLQLASYTPHCAVIHPAKLVDGLARVVEKLGVKIYENSPVTQYQSGSIKTNHVTCRAQLIIRATEGFTSSIKTHRRILAPLYSYMIATSPLTESQLQTLGWKNRETYHDARNMIIYCQLTADKRIAFGGRGAPYHFASRVKPSYNTHPLIHEKICNSMREIFEKIGDLEITHKWGGPLGVPRNWNPSVNFDARSGLGSLGGYVGDGVAASNLAARTMAHLIAEDNHELTQLCWANNQSRKWEVEPLRYFGINGLLKISESIDAYESKTNSPDRIRTKILDTFLG